MSGETILVAALAGLLVFGVSKTVQGMKVVKHKVVCAVKHGALNCRKK